MTLSNRAKHYYQIKFKDKERMFYLSALTEIQKEGFLKTTTDKHHFTHKNCDNIKLSIGNYQLTLVCESEEAVPLVLYGELVSKLIAYSIYKKDCEVQQLKNNLKVFDGEEEVT